MWQWRELLKSEWLAGPAVNADGASQFRSQGSWRCKQTRGPQICWSETIRPSRRGLISTAMR